MSAEKLITDHIDIWTSAVQAKSASGRGSSKKRELYGIKKLRELILDLAVRGKLVPQDPSDEPASVLLDKIKAKKEQLLKDGTLKKLKKAKVHEAVLTGENKPNGWVAVDFGDITFNLDAKRIPLSVNERKGRQGEYDYYGASGVIDSIDDYLFDKPLLLIGEDGANLVNRSTPIAFMARGKYWVNNHAHVIDGISEDFLIYLSLYVNSISLIPYITGMAQPKMNQAKMNAILVLLPPENEQRRIIAKVDELMALCDQLEQQTEASLDAHQVLVETLLATLTNSKDATELMANWTRISEHFDTLFTTEQSIDQLKQTILQLAVMGKLVPFGSNTEKGGLKKFLSFGPRNGYSPKEVKSDTGVKVLKLGATSYGSLDLNESKSVDVDIERDSHLWLNKGDILIQRGNSANYVGCNCLVEEDVSGVIYPDLMMKIRPSDITSSEFLSMWLSSPMAREFMWSRMTGTSGTMPKISKKVVESIPIVMPSRQTQDSIVAKAQDLLSICEHLKQRIRDIQQTQLQLTDTIVEQAL